MKIGAHRGAYKDKTKLNENCMAEFNRAIDFEFDYVEFDVHKTLDGKFIVYHDNSLEINKQKMKIKDISSESLEQNYNLPVTGEKIPYLDQVIKICNGKIKSNIEIRDGNIGSEVCNFLDTLSIGHETYCISSFHEFVLKNVFKDHPNVNLGYLFYKNKFRLKPVELLMSYRGAAIHPWY